MSKRFKHRDHSFIADYITHYRDNTTKKEKETMKALHEKYDCKDESIPPLSQREQEHLTYLMVLNEYNSAKHKRTSYRKYGALTIIISGIVFLALIFSLETKIEFLVLWVISILYCVVVMIRAEYRYNTFKNFLGIADEFDYYGMDDDEEDEEVGTAPPVLKNEAAVTVPAAASDGKAVNPEVMKAGAEQKKPEPNPMPPPQYSKSRPKHYRK